MASDLFLRSDIYVRPFFRFEEDWPAVYVVLMIDRKTGERACKVGYSNDPQRRMREIYAEIGGFPLASALRQDLPVILKLLAAFYVPQAEEVERLVHSALADKRTHREWFSVEPEEAIAAVMDAVRRFGKDFGGDPWESLV